MADRGLAWPRLLQSRRAERRVMLVLNVLVVLLVGATGLAACGSTANSSGGSGNSSAPPGETGNWQTVSESSGSSISQGGGTNNNSSQQQSTVNGPYRVLAACQGGGSLGLQLDPGGSFTVQCTPAKQEPVRIAGSDSAPANNTLSVTLTGNGDLEWYDVVVQVRR